MRNQAYQKLAERFGVDIPYVWLDRAVWAIATQPNVENFVYLLAPGGWTGARLQPGDDLAHADLAELTPARAGSTLDPLFGLAHSLAVGRKRSCVRARCPRSARIDR